MYNLNLAIWMIDKPNSNWLKRKSTIITKELQKYYNDIVVLSDVRLTENGSIKEEMGNTFNWNGINSTDVILWSGMIFCQVCLRIPNQLVTDLHAEVSISQQYIFYPDYNLWTTAQKNKQFPWPVWPDTLCYLKCRQNCP